MIKLYNSLVKKDPAELDLIDPSEVKIYSCGPTIYDNAHIGNLSSFIYADTLNRVLEADGLKVNHVMNLTDIDDKTIRRSHSEFPDDSAEVGLKNLTQIYELAFKEDMKKVGNRIESIKFIKATDSIELMQKLILELYRKKFAYISDDGIYFSIEKYKESGKKYGQLVEIDADNTSKSRINNDEYDKESAHDFALWKFMQPNEPAWSFYIDNKDYLGRPGWHIECSAMSTSLLNQPFDIHTGGVDLMFPHHENEIAQSTANSESTKYANLFFHNEHIFVEGKKMSKSLSNFYTLTDIIEHNIDPIAFRLLVLQSHYRSRADFSWNNVEASQNRLNNLRNTFALSYQAIDRPGEKLDYKKALSNVVGALNDDINSPLALSMLSEFVSQVDDRLVDNDELTEFNSFFAKVDLLFGLGLTKISDISDKIKLLIKKRDEARKDKNWQLSDELRDELKGLEIGIRDTEYGSIWYNLF